MYTQRFRFKQWNFGGAVMCFASVPRLIVCMTFANIVNLADTDLSVIFRAEFICISHRTRK